MIEIVGGSPRDDEVAAIAAALASCHPELVEGRQDDTSNSWRLAMRYPDLEFDDLRSLALRQAQGDTGSRVF